MDARSVSRIVWTEAKRISLMYIALCVVYYAMYRSISWGGLLVQAVGAICFLDGLPALKNWYDRHCEQ